MHHNSALARVMKLVDVGDSKSPAARRAGSSPAPGTTIMNELLTGLFSFSAIEKYWQLLWKVLPYILPICPELSWHFLWQFEKRHLFKTKGNNSSKSDYAVPI